MMNHFLPCGRMSVTFLMLVCFGRQSPAELIVYSNNFEGAVGSEWSMTTTDITPTGGRRFLGQFGNETVSLSLDTLPLHDSVTVSFELFIINSWDGNFHIGDPDVWTLSISGGPTLLHTTFATHHPGLVQQYPDDIGGPLHLANTGASEVETLGYTFFGNAVYDLTFTVPHVTDLLTINFTGSQLSSLPDESWGIDNVSVSVNPVPEPSTLILAICGTLSMFGYGWRKRWANNPVPPSSPIGSTLAGCPSQFSR